jgi:hypothetical protein
MDIATLMELDAVLPITKARLLMGPAGIGKSSVIKQLADKHKAELITLKLSEYEPPDLVGLPYLADDGGEKVTKFARPWWWPTKKDKKYILFLDELDRCREDMHPSAMQLILERTAGGRKLPKNVIVWAACNGEDYITIPIDQALMDRFAVVEFEPTVDEWLFWAKANKVNATVIDFIKQHRGILDTPAKYIGKPNVVAPSRRSWSDFGQTFFGRSVKGEKNLQSFGSVFVGHEASIAFARWVKEKYQAIDPEDIYAGKLKAEDFDILNVACAADTAAENFVEKSKVEQYNCLTFFKNAGPEAFANLFEALPQEASKYVRQFKDIDEYISSMRQQIVKSSNV